MENKKTNKKSEDLDRIQEELVKKDQESRKEPMPVSGKSVFEIKKIKEKKPEKDGGCYG